MYVAAVGSRKASPTLKERAAQMMATLWDKQGKTTILVSGGADGIDKVCEQTWLAFGGELISYRPKKLQGGGPVEDVWGVEVWHLNHDGQNTVHVPADEPTWADFSSAANYRDLLIAERAERGLAFWDGRSRGTAGTVEFFEVQGKPIYVYKEVQDESQS